MLAASWHSLLCHRRAGPMKTALIRNTLAKLRDLAARLVRRLRRSRPAPPDPLAPGVPWDPAMHERPAEWRTLDRPKPQPKAWVQPRPGWMRGHRR